MSRSPKLQRLTAMAVPALLAANAMVLVLGLTGITDDPPAGAETVTYIKAADGTLTVVDPDTPEGWRAIADAERRGEEVVTVAPEEAPPAVQQQVAPSTLLPGVTVPDVSDTLDGVQGTVVETVDEVGETVDGVVDDVTDIVDDTAGTDVGEVVDPAVDEATDTLTTTVSTVLEATDPVGDTVDEVVDTVTSVVTTPPVTIPTLVPSGAGADDEDDEPAVTVPPVVDDVVDEVVGGLLGG